MTTYMKVYPIMRKCGKALESMAKPKKVWQNLKK